MNRLKLAAGLEELRATLLSTCALVRGGWNELALQEAIDVLRSPCACGEPIAEWDGWMGGNQTGGYPLARIRYLSTDVPVHILVFALPAEETE